MNYNLITRGNGRYLESAHITTGEFPTYNLINDIIESIQFISSGRPIIQGSQTIGENIGQIMTESRAIYFKGSIPSYLKAIDEERAHSFFRQLAQNFPHVSFKKMGGGGFLLEVSYVPDKSLEDSLLLDINFHPAAKNHLISEGYGDIINSLNTPYRRKRKEARKNLLMVALANSTLEVKIKNGSYYISPARTNNIPRSKQDQAKSRNLLSPDDISEYDALVTQNLFSSEPVIRR